MHGKTFYYKKDTRINISKANETHHTQKFQRMFANHNIILLWQHMKTFFGKINSLFCDVSTNIIAKIHSLILPIFFLGKRPSLKVY